MATNADQVLSAAPMNHGTMVPLGAPAQPHPSMGIPPELIQALMRAKQAQALRTAQFGQTQAALAPMQADKGQQMAAQVAAFQPPADLGGMPPMPQ